jgi:hypothetical protein
VAYFGGTPVVRKPAREPGWGWALGCTVVGLAVAYGINKIGVPVWDSEDSSEPALQVGLVSVPAIWAAVFAWRGGCGAMGFLFGLGAGFLAMAIVTVNPHHICHGQEEILPPYSKFTYACGGGTANELQAAGIPPLVVATAAWLRALWRTHSCAVVETE